MEGSGPWQLLYVRHESDEQGSYLAIALRRFEKAEPWIDEVRRSLR
jgi:hypothetical protein